MSTQLPGNFPTSNRIKEIVSNSPSANLDFLRAFAVGCVIVSHTGTILMQPSRAFDPLGRTGVLLFFVHTALVLMRSLDRLHADGEGRVAMRFFRQRLFRIYPLYFAALVAAVFEWGQPGGWPALWANIALIGNLTGATPASPPMWSLPYEMQMYLALPLIYLVTRQKDRMAKLALLTLAAMIVSIIILGGGFANPLHPLPAVFFMPCFMAGVFAYTSKAKARVPAWLFPVGLIAVAFFFRRAYALAIEQWGFALFIGFALPRFRELSARWLTSPAKAVAKYSYGIYLWHWPFLALVTSPQIARSLIVRITLFLVATALVSIATYHLIEAPMIRRGRAVKGSSHETLRAHPALCARPEAA